MVGGKVAEGTNLILGYWQAPQEFEEILREGALNSSGKLADDRQRSATSTNALTSCSRYAA